MSLEEVLSIKLIPGVPIAKVIANIIALEAKTERSLELQVEYFVYLNQKYIITDNSDFRFSNRAKKALLKDTHKYLEGWDGNESI